MWIFFLTMHVLPIRTARVQIRQQKGRNRRNVTASWVKNFDFRDFIARATLKGVEKRVLLTYYLQISTFAGFKLFWSQG